MKKFGYLLLTLLLITCAILVAGCNKGDDGEDAGSLKRGKAELQYSKFGDTGTLAVTGVKGSVPETMEIPAEYKGYKVSCVFDGCFKGKKNLRTIILPETVEIIRKDAFNGCSNLAVIQTRVANSEELVDGLPAGVYDVGDGAFSGCIALQLKSTPKNLDIVGPYAFSNITALTEITVNGTTGYVAEGAFQGCTGVTSISVSSPSIGDNAFNGCTAVTSITLGEGVESIGKAAFYGCNGATELVMPKSLKTIGEGAFYEFDKVTKLSLNEGLTSIGGNAFGRCSGITKLDLPASLTEIGFNAFNGCSGITELTLPEKLTAVSDGAFLGCSGITKITFNESLTSIGANAFMDCSGVTELSIPFSVETIGEYAFSGCGFENVTVYKGFNDYGSGSFEGCANLKKVVLLSRAGLDDTVTETVISGGAFSGYDTITEFDLPDDVVAIKLDAFKGTGYYNDVNNWDKGTALYVDGHLVEGRAEADEEAGTTAISGAYTVKEGTISIAASAFANCTELSSITFNSDLKYIDDNAFNGCTSLSSATIPDGIEVLGNGAFKGCAALTSIELPGSVKTLGASTFEGCSALASVTVGNGITGVGDLMFKDCAALTGIVLPESVTSIGSSAFEACFALETITMDKVDTIGIGAFKSCGALVEIAIPDAVTAINDSTFESCTKLTTVSMNNVVALGANAFKGCTEFANITISPDLASVGEDAFADTAIYNNTENWVDNVFYINNIYMIKASDEVSGKVTVPDGVTFIASGALKDCGDITEISIPDSVIAIGDSAFENCTKLSKVSIGSGVKEIGKNAFKKCSALTSITLPSGVTSVGISAFAECAKLTTAKLTGVTDIPESCFQNCKALATIELATGLTSIGNHAFSSTAITAIEFPAGFKTVGANAFSNCSKLTKANVNGLENVETIMINAFSGSGLYGYTSENWDGEAVYDNGKQEPATGFTGGLTSADGKVLLAISPSTKNVYIIKDTVVNVAEYACEGCTGVTGLWIPAGIKKFPASSFPTVMEDGTVKLGSVRDIYFGGTEEQWNAFLEANALTVKDGINVSFEVPATDIKNPVAEENTETSEEVSAEAE